MESSSATAAARPLIEARNQRFVFSPCEQPIWLSADPVRLEQVVVNLLTNAAKYTEDGGQIWLTVRRQDRDAEIRVKDTGVGIDPDLLPRIFDLFTQAERSLDRAQGGLGIGLALVRHLVALHQGGVTAESDGRGQGSEFVVHLPLADPIRLLESPAELTAPPSAAAV